MAVYVYGVVRADARLRLAATGVEGRPVERVERDGLAAVTGEVPEGEVRASRRNLMAHSAVLQEIVDGQGDVLPMRFGTLLPSTDAVRDELLAPNADGLRVELEALAGLVELDVTISCPNDELVQVLVAGSRPLADAARRLREGSYKERLELGERIAGAVNEARDEAVRRLLAAAGEIAVVRDIGEPAHEDMLANVAFLVVRSKVDAFNEAIDAVGARLRAPMRARCVGPLPPYRFADVPLAQEEGAWA